MNVSQPITSVPRITADQPGTTRTPVTGFAGAMRAASRDAVEAIDLGHITGAEDLESRPLIARRGAEELVANALILPAFKMMREDPLRSDLFGRAPGQDAFEGLLDTELAKRMTAKAKFALVDAVARKLLGNEGRARGAQEAPGATTGVDRHG